MAWCRPRARIVRSFGWVNPGAAPRGYTTLAFPDTRRPAPGAPGLHECPTLSRRVRWCGIKIAQPGAEWCRRLISRSQAPDVGNDRADSVVEEQHSRSRPPPYLPAAPALVC